MMRIGVMAAAAVLAALVAAPAQTQAQAVSGRILPERPYVEATAFGQAVNFDFVLDNQGAAPVELSELEVAFLDRDGNQITTRRLDGNGTAPSIDTLPGRTIEPGAERLLFNPFEHAPGGQVVGAVQVRANLNADDADDVVVAFEAPVRVAADEPYLSPVTGRVLVWDGHDELSHHRRWDYLMPPIRALGFVSNAMRYAYDFVPVDAEGRMHSGDGARNEDWFGFGQPVRAPMSGTVVQVRDDRPDDRTFDPTELAQDINLVFGNLVVIQHDDGTFSMLGHVRQDSARVAVGERVEAGQVLAAIGASGSSLFPHLHYQRVDAADMRGEGVPSSFRAVTLARGGEPAHGHIDSGDVFTAR